MLNSFQQRIFYENLKQVQLDIDFFLFLSIIPKPTKLRNPLIPTTTMMFPNPISTGNKTNLNVEIIVVNKLIFNQKYNQTSFSEVFFSAFYISRKQ